MSTIAQSQVRASYIPIITTSATAPISFELGDVYYNTTTDLLYTAIMDDNDQLVWGSGSAPLAGHLYLSLDSNVFYGVNSGRLVIGVGSGSITNPVSVNIDMNYDYKIINLKDGSSSQDAVNKSQLDAKADLADVVLLADKGVANGVAPLDSNGIIPDIYLPTATTQKLGVVKADGVTTSLDLSGTLSAIYPAQYRPPLFQAVWSDHLINEVSWLRADTFSWQNGNVYSAAYAHLVTEFDITKPIEVDTINGISIYYRTSADGHKIVLADGEQDVINLYNATGVAWYYILDTKNQRFKLPRTKYGFTGYRDTVGKYVAPGLPNITGNFYGIGDYVVNSLVASGAFSAGSNVSRRDAAQQDTHSYPSINFSASNSNSIYGNSATVQPPATQMYLYFYVGNFSQSATEQTAGLNSELFNGKVDLDAANLSNSGKSLISGLGMPSILLDLTLGANGSEITAPADGYFRLSGTATNTYSFVALYERVSSSAFSSTTGQHLCVYIPVLKGSRCTYFYSNISDVYFAFVYSEGSKQEAN